MKKWIYILIAVIIVTVAIFVGMFLFKNNHQDNNIVEPIQNKIMNQVQIQSTQNSVTNEISVSTEEKEKISPNAVLILKKHYSECGHSIKEYAEMPEEFVNLTQEELKEKYEGWILEEFSAKEVILRKEIDGNCRQHYVLRSKEGTIAVYRINEDGSETLKEATEISTEYLTQNDKEKLEQGIKIYGEEQLNSTLEDYE